MRFERAAFIAFDIYMLQRPKAAADYSPAEVEAANHWYATASPADKERVYNSCLQGLPGSTVMFTADEVLKLLDSYSHIDRDALKSNLTYFLQEIISTCEKTGIKMAIHPDDPPYQVLGLPRILCNEQDAADLLAAVPSPNNGCLLYSSKNQVRKYF